MPFQIRTSSEGLEGVRLTWQRDKHSDIWLTVYNGANCDLRIFYSYRPPFFHFDFVLTVSEKPRRGAELQYRKGWSIARVTSDDEWILSGILWAEEILLSPMQRLAIDMGTG
jgi:hypothetical protein